MSENNVIKLKNVISSDLKFLYLLLKERDHKLSISHKHMPSFKIHCKFVSSKPYSKWYIVYLKSKKIGSAYLSKQNEIGINMKKQYDIKRIKTEVLNELILKNPRSQYFANISPKNKKGISFFEENRFRLIQKTFELSTNSNKL